MSLVQRQSPDQGPRIEHASSALDREFADWYRTEFPYVRRTLRRLGIPDASLPDLVHDVFVVAWRKRADYDPERALRPWLSGIAFRVAVGHRRRRWLAGLGPWERASKLVDEGTIPVERLERRTFVREALECVSLKLRAVLILHDFGEHSMPEIAEALSIPIKTGYSRLRLARERFLRALGDHGRISSVNVSHVPTCPCRACTMPPPPPSAAR
jgi:RNA polymerase sigma-70 factor, ECF subfamily